MKNSSGLWTKNFTTLVIGTVATAIGSTAMSFVLGIVVFNETASSWLTGLFSAASMVPIVVLPIFAAPLVDRSNRKWVIVWADVLNAFVYLAFGLYLMQYGFSYPVYIILTLTTNSVGAVYQLAFNAFYPDLITEGFEQKGFSIASLVYPSVTALFTPIASLVYTHYGATPIFFLQTVMLLTAAAFESRIAVPARVKTPKAAGALKRYKDDLLEGIRYLKKEKGVRSIYTYMMCAGAAGEANLLMAMTYFESTPGLGRVLYSFLTSAETIGRVVGGLTHYLVQIPKEKRFAITEKVYFVYESLDGIMLFFAYPVMLVIRFILGFLGVNSATLREAAVLRYLPSNIRARVSALFNVLMALGIMVLKLAVGALGEVFPYRMVSVGVGIFGVAAILLLVVRNRDSIGPLYNPPKKKPEAAVTGTG